MGNGRPFFEAVWKKDLARALSLATDGDPDERDHAGMTRLMHAVLLQVPAVAEALLEAGADPNLTRDFGDTALHIAAEKGNLELVGTLTKHGARIVAREDGKTPLHLAAGGGHDEVALALVEHGGDPAALDRSGVSPLLQAARNCSPATVRALLGLVEASERGDRALRALHAAAQRNDGEILETILDAIEPGVEARSALDGALHAAAWSAALQSVKLLLSRGASVEAPGLHRRRPLHTAVSRGGDDAARREIVERMLERGADPEVAVDGYTPLALARSHGLRLCAAALEGDAPVDPTLSRVKCVVIADGDYGISFCPNDPVRPVMLISGHGRDRQGAAYSPQRALETKRDFFRSANAEWFVPFLERYAKGAEVDLAALETAALEATGEALEILHFD